MDKIEIKKMTTIERLQAIEALWSSLLYEDGEIDSPDWHKDILEEGKKSIKNGKAKFVTIKELKTNRNT